MYIPPQFEVTDSAKLHEFMESHSFAVLVTHVEGEPLISHLPLLLDREGGEFGVLLGHFARANRHADVAHNGLCTAIFSGPHAYISPSWYEDKNVVPTWNYVAVHAHGELSKIDDINQTVELLSRMTRFYERSNSKPWSVDDNSPNFVAKLASQVAAFTIRISHLEGAWKLSQHHPEPRRQKVANELLQADSGDSQAIGRLMRDSVTGDSN